MRLYRFIPLALIALLTMAAADPAEAQFFEQPRTQTFFSDYRQPVIGDLNGDQRADVIVLGRQGDLPETWHVLFTDAAGNLSWMRTLAPGPGTPTIGDVDGDGYRDIVLPQSSGFRVYWGSLSDQFAEYTDVEASRPLSNIAVGDVTGDNVPDLVFGRSTTEGNRLSLLPGAVGRQFGELVALPHVGYVREVAIGHANQDGRPDLFVLLSALQTPTPRATILLGGGGSTFTALEPVNLPDTQVQMSVGDVTRDGMDEAIVTSRGFNVDMVTLSGETVLLYNLSTIPPAAAKPNLSDVDGDGLIDVTFAVFNSPTAIVLHGRDDGQFLPGLAFAIAANVPAAVGFGDTNDDGAPDVIALERRTTQQQTDVIVTRHVTPLRIVIFAPSATAGSSGTANVTVEAMVPSGQTDVTLAWFNGETPIGTGTRLFLSLPVGTHTLIVEGSTPSGLRATASTVLTIAPLVPPASETTVTEIQNTLNARLDVTLSSRASQESVTELATRVTSIQAGLAGLAMQSTLVGVGTLLQTQLDATVGSRASAADVAAIANKVDQLQARLPSTASLESLTHAVNALRASLGADQTRLAIEQALARGDKIASFYLPTAHGGQLDLVRAVVLDVAAKVEAASATPLDVAKARRVIAEGDARKAAGDYRGAYQLYSVAYQILGA